MPSYSYTVNDPVSGVSYKPKKERQQQQQHQNGKSNGHNEKWRQNYVPTPYDPIKAGPSPTSDALEVEEGEDSKYDRGTWGSKAEFILSCVGLSVGIGNVWRFPYLAYQNGGGAFLLPYFIILILVGKPMYFMEVALGQYCSLGPLSVWKCAPIMRGVGFAMVTISLIVAIYYNVVMCYTLFYMFASWSSYLPWSKCESWWGADEFCYVRHNKSEEILPYCKSWVKKMEYKGNLSDVVGVKCTNIKYQTATEQYYERYVLNMTSSLGEPGDIGEIRWELALCLLLSWIVVFLCLIKGIKSSGKVVYFTATFPYVILIALLVRGVTLDGAELGIYEFFVPKWEKLLDITVWRKAAEQMFFSLSVSWGGLIMFGSYNKFRNKVHYDALFVSSLDFLTSVMAGVVIFSVLGAMSKELNIDVEDVAKGGPGLAFVAYPEAIARLPLPQLWSVLFFFMLFTLGLDSEFALLETFTTAIYDEFPKTRTKKTLVTALTCISCYLIALPCVSQAGTFIQDLMDTYTGMGVLLIAIMELFGLMWIYGVQRFCADLKFMLGFTPNMYWKACWLVVAPAVLISIFSYSMYKYEEPKYAGEIPYPEWAHYIGWFLALVSVAQIPLIALFTALYYIGKRRPKGMFQPTPEWGPGDRMARRELLARKAAYPNGKFGLDNPAMDSPRY